MRRRYTQTMAVACFVVGFAVILGAFGAHALRHYLGEHGPEIWDTAIRYHFYHGIGMLVLLMLGRMYRYPRLFLFAAWVMFGGILFFCGSLYLLALNPTWRWLGPVTPFGGLFFIAGWTMCGFALVIFQSREKA
jgi:uncharacterized membrane protein YgdD (TMEM256/DUF423 family)